MGHKILEVMGICLVASILYRLWCLWTKYRNGERELQGCYVYICIFNGSKYILIKTIYKRWTIAIIATKNHYIQYVGRGGS